MEANKTNNAMHSRLTKAAKNAGFTIIELMVVVVIIGLVGAIALPNFARLKNSMSFEAAIGGLKGSIQKCRASALINSNPVTMPTALMMFGNGFACISWEDINGDFMLGSGPIDMGPNFLLDVGEANNEVRAVYMQENFNDGAALNAIVPGGIARIDTAGSLLQGPATAQDDGSGYAFIFASGGYVLAADRTQIVARVWMVPANGSSSMFLIYPSGQIQDQRWGGQ